MHAPADTACLLQSLINKPTLLAERCSCRQMRTSLSTQVSRRTYSTIRRYASACNEWQIDDTRVHVLQLVHTMLQQLTSIDVYNNDDRKQPSCRPRPVLQKTVTIAGQNGAHERTAMEMYAWRQWHSMTLAATHRAAPSVYSFRVSRRCYARPAARTSSASRMPPAACWIWT